MANKSQTKKVKHECPVKLTDPEMVERAGTLGKLFEELGETEEAAKKSAKDHRAKIKDLKERLDKLSDIVRSKREFREIECYEEQDFDKGVVVIFRCDTNERVHARALKDEDRQANI